MSFVFYSSFSNRAFPVFRYLLFFTTHFTLTRSTCYYPNGKSNYDIPCTTNSSFDHCCGKDSICLANKVCLNIVGNKNVFARGSCTDKSWSSPACPSFCLQEQSSGGGANIITCPPISSGIWCCPLDDGDSCCNDPNRLLTLGQISIVDSRPSTSIASESLSSSTTVDSLVSISSPTSTTFSSLISISTTVDSSVSISSPTSTASSSLISISTTVDSSVSISSPTSTAFSSLISISTATSSGGTIGPSTPASSGLSESAKVGIGTVVPLGSIVIALVLYVFYRNSQLRAKTNGAEGKYHLQEGMTNDFQQQQTSTAELEVQQQQTSTAELEGHQHPELASSAAPSQCFERSTSPYPKASG